MITKPHSPPLYHWALISSKEVQKNAPLHACFLQAQLTLSADFAPSTGSIHPQRLQERTLSRMALWECLRMAKLVGDSTLLSSAEVQIVNHHHLKYFPQQNISLSHTSDGACALLAGQQHYLSVGIDMEKKSRPIKTGAERFFLRPDDQYQDLLHLWCAKEAAYKALCPLTGPNTAPLFSSIAVSDDHFSWGEFTGHLDYQTSPEHVVAIALLKHPGR